MDPTNMAKFSNPFYEGGHCGLGATLRPTADHKDMTVWAEYYLRWQRRCNVAHKVSTESRFFDLAMRLKIRNSCGAGMLLLDVAAGGTQTESSLQSRIAALEQQILTAQGQNAVLEAKIMAANSKRALLERSIANTVPDVHNASPCASSAASAACGVQVRLMGCSTVCRNNKSSFGSVVRY